MLWYIAFIAVLNLGLGYALAVHLGAGGRRRVGPASSFDEPIEDAAESDDQINESPQGELEEVVDSVADLQPLTEKLADGVDPTTGLATREYIERRLAELKAAHTEQQSTTIALVEIDQAVEESESIGDRLLGGIAETVRELLAATHSAGRHSDRQFLLLLPQDDMQHATERIEQVRQLVESTHYVADGRELSATVTCAVAELAAERSIAELQERLVETIDEAKRYGGNRTFVHDGTSPAPVVPPELNYAPRTCAI